MDLGLKGKNILLIGGHSNIGKQVTLAFAREGAGVTIGFGHDQRRAEDVAKEALALGAPWAEIIQVDAMDYGQTAAAVDKALEHGDLDCVYHGILWSKMANFFELDRSNWQKMYESTFVSVMNCWHYALPIMCKAGHGCFVNMASTMGRMHAENEPVYGALKAAVIHLGQNLAQTVGPYKVRINFVAPGPTPPKNVKDIASDSCWQGYGDNDPTFAKNRKIWEGYSPLHQFGEPMDNAYAVLYLASELSGRHLTGQIIGTDGGNYMPK